MKSAKRLIAVGATAVALMAAPFAASAVSDSARIPTSVRVVADQVALPSADAATGYWRTRCGVVPTHKWLGVQRYELRCWREWVHTGGYGGGGGGGW